jgi:hypothetical protein
MLRRCAFSAVLICFLAGWLVAADRADTVKIMTQNMDAGTDHGYVIGAAFGMLGSMTVAQAVDLTFSGIQASNLEQRATLLAQKIALEAPDIVALQEATLWQASLRPSGSVTYDQLALLLAALKRIGSPYEILAVNQVNDLTLPGSQLLALREVERDALLVRASAAPPTLHFSNVHTRIYAESFPSPPLSPPFTLPRGGSRPPCIRQTDSSFWPPLTFRATCRACLKLPTFRWRRRRNCCTT